MDLRYRMILMRFRHLLMEEEEGWYWWNGNAACAQRESHTNCAGREGGQDLGRSKEAYQMNAGIKSCPLGIDRFFLS